ncbi:MAG TPA: hypothetical protein VHE81_14205, partial [Lacipirellulaceae bacterium]|nr:hypothetical protein [Lacipirellulaceae bacterium]
MILPTPIPWKRFSLRSLFVLMTLCCFVFGLWSVYVNPYRLQLQSLAAVNRVNGQSTPAPAEGPPWQRWLVTTLLGNDAFVRITEVNLANRRPVGDDVLRSLTGLRSLEQLTLDYTQITDDGLASLQSLHALHDLSLRYTNVSDRGARYLSTLPNLQHLTLTGTKISDAGADELARLKQMQSMYIRWTRISDNGAERLRQALPECKVFHNAL